MQKYKASDIIKRAKSLANMKNTSFLTYKEMNDYLQLAWKQAYQAAINRGCNYYLKTVKVNGNGEYNLPWDFYQCESIRTKGGSILQRHNSSTPDCVDSYDIIGNKLRIYGGYGSYEMRYWQSPFYLSFPADEVKVTIPDYQVLNVYKQYVAMRNNDDFVIYDISESKEIVSINNAFTGITDLYVLLGKGTFIIRFDQDNTHHYIRYNYKGDVLESGEYTSVTLFTLDAKGIIHIINENSDIWDSFTVTPNVTENAYWIDNIIVGETTLTDFVSGNVYQGTKVIGTLVFDEWPAVMVDTSIQWYNDGHLFIESSDVDDYNVYGFTGANFETGYGFLTSDGTDTYIKSFIPDTELDFPNTLMFEYMAYILAYYFVLQSGQDSTQVTSLLSAAEESFFDSLDNGGTYPVINNVYEGDGLWLI